VAAARLSARLTGLSGEESERIRQLLERAGLPTTVNLSAAQRRKVLAAMMLDKKVSGGEVKFVLARRIGEVVFGQQVPAAELQAVLETMGKSPTAKSRKTRI